MFQMNKMNLILTQFILVFCSSICDNCLFGNINSLDSENSLDSFSHKVVEKNQSIRLIPDDALSKGTLMEPCCDKCVVGHKKYMIFWNVDFIDGALVFVVHPKALLTLYRIIASHLVHQMQ